jgi:hypothetical protein
MTIIYIILGIILSIGIILFYVFRNKIFRKKTDTSLLKSSWAKETVDHYKNKKIKIFINDKYNNEPIVGKRIVKNMSTNEKKQIEKLLRRTMKLSKKGRIKLEFVDDYDKSTLIITLASMHDLDDLDLYGQYTNIKVDGKKYLLIVLNPKNLDAEKESVIKQNVLHEFGHFLGLKHPFDCSGYCDIKHYGRKYTITDTFMAYDRDENNFTPKFFTKLDRKAIKEIWDDENYY